MHNFNALFLHISLVLSYCGTITAAEKKGSDRLFDFKLTKDMKGSDADVKTSALGKLIKFVVKGKDKSGEYLAIESKGKDVELGIQIKDSSIFCPGDKPENCQNGFRRTDVLPAVDGTKTFSGTTVFHQSFRLDPKLPLDFTHGYLLSSIEIPASDHIFDIFTGADFDADSKKPNPKNTGSKKVVRRKTTSKQKTPKTIRIRDLTTKVLHSIPLKEGVLYNTAIAVDWTENTLTVYASEGDKELKKIIGPVKNSEKAKVADIQTKGEYHLQLIKFPLPDPKDPVEKRKDVPHFGIQKKGIHEGVFFSRSYVEDGTKGKITTSVTGGAAVTTSKPKTKPTTTP